LKGEPINCPACGSTMTEPLNQYENGINYNCLNCGQRFAVQESYNGTWIIVKGDLIVKRGVEQRHNMTVVGSIFYDDGKSPRGDHD